MRSICDVAACLTLLVAVPAVGVAVLSPSSEAAGRKPEGVAQLPEFGQSRFSNTDGDSEFGGGITVHYPGCEEDARPDLARKFQRTYLEKFASTVADVFKATKRATYLTVGEVRNAMLLRNFLAHIKNVSATDMTELSVVNVQLDKDGMVECEKARKLFQSSSVDIQCTSLAGWLPKEFFGRGINAGAGTCVYNMIIWTKPDIFLTAVKASPHDVMLIDTDVMLYHDLFQLGKKIFTGNHEARIVVARENKGRRNPNTGTVLANQKGENNLKQWIERNFAYVSSQFGDQGAFANLSKTDDRFWKQTGCFSPAEVGQCGNRGYWATHYNCLGGRKGTVMRNRGDWNKEADGKFGQKEGQTPRTYHRRTEAEIGFHDNLEELTVQALQAAGEWWVDE